MKKQCCITFCDLEEKLVASCDNGHYIHISCLKNLPYQSKKCPLCRDSSNYLDELRDALQVREKIDININSTERILVPRRHIMRND